MPDNAAVQEALERIVASAGFVNSPRMSRFLRFVVEETAAGRAAGLKEYVVGLRVFDKAESFDPTVDPTIRVEASKLRAKLARYYETEGRGDSTIIEIPKGHYGARFCARPDSEQYRSPAVEAAPASPARPRGRYCIRPTGCRNQRVEGWGPAANPVGAGPRLRLERRDSSPPAAMQRGLCSSRRRPRRRADHAGRAAVPEPDRRSRTAVPLRRADRGDDRPSRRSRPLATWGHRPHVGDALQETRRSEPTKSRGSSASRISSRRAFGESAIACESRRS